MDIKSSLLNSNSMRFVKNSLIEASEKDGKQDFRVRALEYINDSSDDSDDEFFYDMLEFIRFTDPSSDSVAYTTPDHLIFLNMPNKHVGENVRQWDFVYDHECLHQLWDTFGVESRIENELGKCDHQILNIASDCVINDYLSHIRKKDEPNGLVTPEYLKEQFDVDYNRKEDTQYTLYLKLIEVADDLKKDKRVQDAMDDMDNQGQSGSSQSREGQSDKQSSGSSSGSSSGQSSENTAESAEKTAKEAQAAADKAKEKAEKSGSSEDKQKAKEAQAAADKAKEAAKEAKDAKASGDKEGEEKAAKEAQAAADKAKKAAGDKEGDDSSKKNDKNGKKGEGKGAANDNTESDEDIEKIRKDAEDIINKYKERISGDLGQFLDKCRSSQKMEKTGLVSKATKGASQWNQKLKQTCMAYIKNKVFQKQREFKRTYQKVKRGSGFVEYGQPIQRGKKIKDDKLIISVAFYVDRSGSMDGCINEVFKASYVIAEALKKQFGKERVVGGCDFKMFAFDDYMHNIEWGKKMTAKGGTMEFDKLVEYIQKNTNECLINVIVTDAGFSEINDNKVNKFLKDINGCVIFVTNVPSDEIKDIANKNKTKLFYIEADEQFTIG